jgi:hypothetical protein
MIWPPLGGQISVFALWSWSAPPRVANDTCDFWFASGIGLVVFAQDGVAHERITLP